MTGTNNPEHDGHARLRTPPHSIEAEQSVLGGLLLDNRAWDRASDLLADADFYRHEHRVVYGVIGTLIIANKPADVITVYERLQSLGKAEECGGLSYLNDLAQSVPSAAHLRHYAEIVRERSVRRAMIAAADQVAASAWAADGDLGTQLEQAVGLFGRLQGGQAQSAPVPLSSLLMSAVDRYSELAEGKRPAAWSTGIPRLDRTLSGGLRPKKVYGIAARPSVGKSSLARSIALSVARAGLPVLLLSQEMPGDEVADCAVAQLGNIPSDRLQTGQLDESDWGGLADACEEGARLPVYVDDEGALTLGAIRSKARAVSGLRVLIVDYLQLTGSTLRDTNRNLQIEEVSRGLKSLAMAMGIAVIVVSQLNRAVEQRADKEPVLGDLRDSGAIEQDLDVAILLWTAREFDDGARRIVGCKVAKHRGGAKGRFALEFRASTYRWYESEASLDGPTLTEQRGAGRKPFEG